MESTIDRRFVGSYQSLRTAFSSGLRTIQIIRTIQITGTGKIMRSKRANHKRLLIVSNRLPLVLSDDDDGNLHIEHGTGGLVTALAPVLRNRGGVWIGWPGIIDRPHLNLEEKLREATRDFGYTFKTVSLNEKEIEKYYYGFANEIIWPLFHDLQTRCNFDPSTWIYYQEVNRKFAEVIRLNARKDDQIWVHDYHLMTTARELRIMGMESPIGFFLHIPFPPPDLFLKLPWRFHILHALLNYDLIGFQTQRDRRNFVQCVRLLLNDITIRGKGEIQVCHVNNRDVRIGAFPISIDYHEFAKQAASREVADRAWYIHEDLPERNIILGIDRLDYTKGIPERLQAFRTALKQFPELCEKVTLIQVVVPSRRQIPKYRDLKIEIEGLVGEINGEFTRSGWVPIHYIFRSLERTELLAYYRTAETALITPLKDGMNLVAKEYCACNVDKKGVLILSEFAGAATQLQKGALVVNPYDYEDVACKIYQAYRMSREERLSRMRKLRRSVRTRDIYWWVDSFLDAVFSQELDDFPALDDYVPVDEVINEAV